MIRSPVKVPFTTGRRNEFVLESLKEMSIGMKAAALSLFSRTAAQQYLVGQLGHIPGLPAKAAQVLGSKFDGAAIQPPAMPLEQVQHILAQEAPQLSQMISVLRPATSTASLGQVHEAWLRDGRHVAIKIQWPGIREHLKEQVHKLLGWGRLSPANRFGLDWIDYESTLLESLSSECDYMQEAQHQSFFGQAYANSTEIVIPKAYTELSTHSVLVQSFEESLPMSSLTDQPMRIRSEVSHLASQFVWERLLNPGYFHSDLHPKNLGFRLNPTQLVIYDYGSCIPITEDRAIALRNLRDAALAQNQSQILTHLVRLGFDERKLALVYDGLGAFARGLFLNSEGHQELKESLGAKKWYLRTAGPAWFLGILRSLYHLRALMVPSNTSSSVKKETSKLCVRVTEASEPLVELELPATAVDHLEDLISPELQMKIQSQSLDLRAIQKRVQESQYAAQTLFQYREGDKEYRVWVE